MIINEESIKLILEKNPAVCLLAMTTAAISRGKLKKGVICGPGSDGVQTGMPIALSIKSPKHGLFDKDMLQAAATNTRKRDNPLNR